MNEEVSNTAVVVSLALLAGTEAVPVLELLVG